MPTRSLLFALTSLVAVTMVFSFREEIDEKTFGAYDQVDGSKCDEPCESPKYCQTWKTCTQKKYRLTTGASAGEIRIDSPDCKPYPGQEPEGTAYYCLGYIEKLNPFSKKTRKVEVGVDESKCVEPCEATQGCHTVKTCTVTENVRKREFEDCQPAEGEEPEDTAYFCAELGGEKK